MNGVSADYLSYFIVQCIFIYIIIFEKNMMYIILPYKDTDLI